GRLGIGPVSTSQPVAEPAAVAHVAVTPTEATPDRAAERPARPGRPDVSLSYVPGFDGIRGAALVLMLLGHHGWSVIPGAIFTVSMFFTLSGFLIATLMLSEWSRSGRVSLARFWERRARRLLPAALVAIAGVVVLHLVYGL